MKSGLINILNSMVKMHLGRQTCALYFLLFSMFAMIHGFVVEDTCVVNGQICTQDTDCCSYWCIFQGHFWTTTCKATSNCNGNCPCGICRGCQCPTAKNTVDIDAYCSSDSGWSSKCCKCLVNRLSGGNSNFERFVVEKTEIGVLPINTNSFYFSPCNIRSVKPCDWQANKQCAQTIYKLTNSWVNWESDAKACGCSN